MTITTITPSDIKKKMQEPHEVLASVFSLSELHSDENPKLVTKLFELYQARLADKVKGLVYRNGGALQADDIANEAILGAYERRRDVQTFIEFDALINDTARNLRNQIIAHGYIDTSLNAPRGMRDHKSDGEFTLEGRIADKYALTPLDLMIWASEKPSDEELDQEADALEADHEAKKKQILEAANAVLSPRHLKLFYLRYIEGKTFKEIERLLTYAYHVAELSCRTARHYIARKIQDPDWQGNKLKKHRTKHEVAEDYPKIITAIKAGKTIEDVAQEYDVTKHTIAAIVRRHQQQHPLEVIDVATRHGKELKNRDAKIIAALKEGEVIEDVAQKYSLSVFTIRDVARYQEKNSLEVIDVATRHGKELKNRNAKIIAALKAGKTIEDVAQTYGLAVTGIRTFVTRYQEEHPSEAIKIMTVKQALKAGHIIEDTADEYEIHDIIEPIYPLLNGEISAKDIKTEWGFGENAALFYLDDMQGKCNALLRQMVTYGQRMACKEGIQTTADILTVLGRIVPDAPPKLQQLLEAHSVVARDILAHLCIDDPELDDQLKNLPLLPDRHLW